MTKQKKIFTGFSIPTLNSITELLNQETSKTMLHWDNDSIIVEKIFGKMFHIRGDSRIYLNITGHNNTINDWYIVQSNKDPILLKTLHQAYDVSPDIELEVNFDIDKLYQHAEDNQRVNSSRYAGSFCNNRRLRKEIEFAIQKVDTINQMLSISYDDSDSILGALIQVDSDYVWINTTGKNGSINDWHKIESTDDFVVVKIMRQLDNTSDLIDLIVKFNFDVELPKLNIEEKDPKDLDLVIKEQPFDYYHIHAPASKLK